MDLNSGMWAKWIGALIGNKRAPISIQSIPAASPDCILPESNHFKQHLVWKSESSPPSLTNDPNLLVQREQLGGKHRTTFLSVEHPAKAGAGLG